MRRGSGNQEAPHGIQECAGDMCMEMTELPLGRAGSEPEVSVAITKKRLKIHDPQSSTNTDTWKANRGNK